MSNTFTLTINSKPQAPRDILNMPAGELSTTELAAVLQWRKTTGDGSLPDAAIDDAAAATAKANLEYSVGLMKAKEVARQAREAEQVARQAVEDQSYCGRCNQKGHSLARCQVVRAEKVVLRGGRRGQRGNGVQKRR